MVRSAKITPEASLQAEIADIDTQISALLERRNRIEQSLLVLTGEPSKAISAKRKSATKTGNKALKKPGRKPGQKSTKNASPTSTKTGISFFLGLMKPNVPMTRQDILVASLKKLKMEDTAEARKQIGARIDNTLSRMVSAGAIASEGSGSTRTFTKPGAEAA